MGFRSEGERAAAVLKENLKKFEEEAGEGASDLLVGFTSKSRRKANAEEEEEEEEEKKREEEERKGKKKKKSVKRDEKEEEKEEKGKQKSPTGGGKQKTGAKRPAQSQPIDFSDSFDTSDNSYSDFDPPLSSQKKPKPNPAKGKKKVMAVPLKTPLTDASLRREGKRQKEGEKREKKQEKKKGGGGSLSFKKASPAKGKKN